jgi:hypothetical protein
LEEGLLFDAVPLKSPKEEAAHWFKIAVVIIGLILLIPVGLLAAFWVYSLATYVPSKIVDFHPTQFSAKADRRFFYSIGNDLKNSDEIATTAPTLLRGKFGDFLVSPDETKIALVANGHLWVIGRDGNFLKDIAPVDSIYREPKPVGQSFFRDDHFQWTRDSGSIYLIKDVYHASKGSQLYSEKGELWRYNLGSGMLEVVLKPFRGYECFFGLKGIYFSVPTQEGDLRLQYFDGTRVSDIGPVGAFSIPVDQLQKGFIEIPFFSFSAVYFENAYFAVKGLTLKTNERAATQSLEINGKNYLTFTQGNGFKGHYYCSELQKSRFLPGDRYLTADTSCENFDGTLMIDTQSGAYEELPKNTRVLTTLNTISHPIFRVTSSGMMDW